ncbi:hypothetical protein MRS44_007227 [Fusarium solani]|uniref:Uncharacterized protein n=1 Tax=Fusarium solani TaxID=169388 RepID=A0A9P9H2V6_FUSSL|nr:uncharacterized protein B0J15DRAFT_527357 [Fusarium solani]KAH7249482.1 hypothetical protein B0J15DRAFT_527357 [Fusarium solani]KAJ3462441.1 hypothetical protein MRS44_007227 [Fusarium solani]KAJ4213977.1 hypothetical protein NW759_010506 [Fusarium solani]
MKVSFAALGLLLISAAQALPLPEAHKCRVAKVQNSTAPVTKSLHKRDVKGWNALPGLATIDDMVLGIFYDWARKVTAKKQPISKWHDKENNRFESNSWALSPHEVSVLEAWVDETGQPAWSTEADVFSKIPHGRKES